MTLYNYYMIKSFADRHTATLFLDGCSRKLPPDIMARAIRKLDRIDAAYAIEDLRMPPGNRLHQLEGNRAGQWSISINDQWRICFAWSAGGAENVEIVDYH